MKKVLLVDPIQCSLVDPIKGLCKCEAEQVFDLRQAKERMEQIAYDFMIIDPYRFRHDSLADWLADFRLTPSRPKVILLSSCERNFLDEKLQTEPSRYYDFFVYTNPWPALKEIINN